MDDLTEKAIALLRLDGRASYSELSRTLGTSRMNIASRLSPMFEDDSLRVVAATHPRLLGLNVLGYLRIAISGPVAPVSEFIAQQRQPVFISEVTGPFQLVVELHTESLRELQDQVQLFRAIQGVIEIDVMTYERMLSSFFLGEEPTGLSKNIDSVDLALMSLLQHDGRRSYSDLASEVTLSISAVRARVARLLDLGAMQIGVIRGRGDGRQAYTYGMGFTLTGSDESLVAELQQTPGLEFSARSIGRYDIIATMSFASLASSGETFERLRAVSEVKSVDSWLHVKVRLERYHHSARLATDLRKRLSGV